MRGCVGVDQGAGVKLLVQPPSYSGRIRNGYVALQPGTCGSYIP